MSLFLKENMFYPQILMYPADDDGGSGGGGSDGDDGDNGDNDDGGGDGDDKGSDDGDKKRMIDMKDIKGDDDKKSGDDDGDDDDKDKKGDDDKKAERPDFIKEKFWDPEKGEPRLEAMAKAYDDLEKKMGNNKAPDEYKIELNEDLEKIFDKTKADDDPLLKWFKGYAKENNFSQEMFTEMLQEFGKEGAQMLAANAVPPIDPKEEIGKLGKNGNAIIENQVKFLSTLFKQGHVNEDQMQEMLILTETAAGVQALQALRNYYGDAQKIPQNLTPGGGVKSKDELMKMQADDRYGNDQEFTDMVDKEYEKKYGTGASGESQQSPL